MSRDPYGAAIRPDDCRDATPASPVPRRYARAQSRDLAAVATLETGRAVRVERLRGVGGLVTVPGCTAILPGAWRDSVPWHCLPFPPVGGWWGGPLARLATETPRPGRGKLPAQTDLLEGLR